MSARGQVAGVGDGGSAVVAELRRRIAALERQSAVEGAARPALAFGLAALDAALPEGGLARGSLHEILPAAPTAADFAAATLFAAAVLARAGGPVLWCRTAADLFAPALAAVGLSPDRLVHAEAPDGRGVLAAMEEALRHGGLGGVLGETERCGLTESRRLQLAAGARGTLALALLRPPARAAAAPVPPAPVLPAPALPASVPPASVLPASAAATRWRIGALPSPEDGMPGLGRALWRVSLTRCRGGAPGEWIVEAPDAEGRLAVPALVSDRPAAPLAHAG